MLLLVLLILRDILELDVKGSHLEHGGYLLHLSVVEHGLLLHLHVGLLLHEVEVGVLQRLLHELALWVHDTCRLLGCCWDKELVAAGGCPKG